MMQIYARDDCVIVQQITMKGVPMHGVRNSESLFKYTGTRG